jgi:hypothetical protein
MHMNTLNGSLGFIGRIVAVIGLGATLAACGDNATTASTAGSSSAGSATVAATVVTERFRHGGYISTSTSSKGSTSTTGSTSSSGSTRSSSSSTPSNSTSPTGSSGTAPTAPADSITLSWAAPTENTDGTALTNLSGFNIFYGTSASAMTQQVSINSVGLLSYVVQNLTSGTWYFEVVAVNSSGVQSGPSSVVSVTI